MGEVYGYIAEEKYVLQKLGNFISHKIVNKKDSNNQRMLRETDEINKLDRIELAITFMSEIYEVAELRGLPSEIQENFIKITALYIDKRIPKSYKKWFTKDHEKGPQQIQITEEEMDEYGLEYQFNSKRELFNMSLDKYEESIKKIIESKHRR